MGGIIIAVVFVVGDVRRRRRRILLEERIDLMVVTPVEGGDILSPMLSFIFL